MRQRRGKGGNNVARKKTSASKKGIEIRDTFYPINSLNGVSSSMNNRTRSVRQIDITPASNFGSSSGPRPRTSNVDISSLMSMNESDIYDVLQALDADSIRALISFSIQMYRQSGIYRRAVSYFGNMLPFDHYITPYTVEASHDVGMEEFRNVALGVSRYRIKKIMPQIMKRIMVHGTSYQYKLENSERIEFFDLPWEYCKVRAKENAIYRVIIDLSQIPEEDIIDDDGEPVGIYPDEIANAWVDWDAGTINEEVLIDDDWLILSDEAFALTLDENILINDGVGIPFLLASMLDGIRYEKAKAMLTDADGVENAKIIDMKFKVNENGENLMDEDTVIAFVNMINDTLPEGVQAIASPFDNEVLNLQGTGATGKLGLAEKHQANFMRALGINPLVFGQEANSGEAMKLSIKLDHNILFAIILPQIEAYMDYELERNMNQFGSWRLKMPTVSHAFRSDVVELEATGLTVGTERLAYWATLGREPIEVINTRLFEHEVLDIDSWMMPKQNANTLAAPNDDGGRPEESDVSASGEQTRDRQ